MDNGKIAAQGTPVDLKSRYVSDILKVYPKKNQVDNLKNLLKSKNIKYKTIKDSLNIPIKSTFAALPMVDELKDYIFDFEVQKGTMDNLFVAVTGKEIR